MSRLFFCLFAVSFLLGTLYAQDAQKTAADFTDRFQLLEQETQAQISAIEQQMAEADAVARENLNRQIEQTKASYEIQRLEILLEQAEFQSDEIRAAEIRHALERRLNPETPAIINTERSAPSAPGTMPESHSNHR